MSMRHRRFTGAAVGVALVMCLAPAMTHAQSTPMRSPAAAPRVDESPLLERRVIGTSVEGRDIEAFRYGTPGGTVVMVVGVIHGDEEAGLQIVEILRTMSPPDGIDLWIIPTMNPDGTIADTRGNARRVDLNRNFPRDWAPQGEPGYWQYAGPAAASEPETKAMVEFVRQTKPALGIWYHQDLNMISPGTGFEGRVRARYARLTNLPLVRITGGRYTGVAATWQRNAVKRGLAFVVELGPQINTVQARQHAEAVMTVARMVQANGRR
jgi:protein MpaA